MLLAGLMLSAVMTAFMIHVGENLGAMDSRGAAGHQKQLRRVPNIGGAAVVTAFVLPAALGLAYVRAHDAAPTRAPDHFGLEQFHARIGSNFASTAAMLAGAVWLMVAGMIDDRRAMSASTKLLLQFVPAVAIAWMFQVRPLTLLDHHGPVGHAASVMLGVLWIVAMINAMNFLDNMDGLASGVGMIAALLFATMAMIVQQWFIAGLFALLAGALAGFLIFNFAPRVGARIFLGDGGSQPLGFLLAVLALRTTFISTVEPAYGLGTHWWGILAPLIILAVPLYDMAATSVIRLRHGHRPWVGDQRHLSHRLVQRGFSSRGAVLIIWAMSAIIGAGGIIIGNLAPLPATLVVLQTVAALLVLAAMEGIFRR
jgi:UDP-GlcNAc:undecaprenyl-phosphate GlcNAc-1-phosphate transferase